MSSLKIGDRVKVRPAKEHDPTTQGAVGTITRIGPSRVDIKFDDLVDIDSTYTERELDKLSSSE